MCPLNFFYQIDNFPQKIIKVAKYPLFSGKTNSEHTFISSTFKVEETKVPSEFIFPHKKVDIWQL